MKTAVYISVFLLLASCKKDVLHWQEVRQLDAHTRSRLNRAVVGPEGKIIISGGEKFSRAEVLVSADDGNTWQLDSFPQAGKGLYGLASSPSGNIYMSGIDGKLVFSTDSCRSWQFRQLGVWRYNVGIAFPEDDHGILIGTITSDTGIVAHIDGAGNETTAERLYPFGLNDIDMTDDRTGFLAGYGVILKTTDGGHNWQFMSPKNDNFKALHCLDARHIFACGAEGGVYRSADGGNSWEQLRNGNDLTRKQYRFEDILFVSELHGYVVGEHGAILYTDDGGYHWSEIDRFTDQTLHFIVRARDGYLITGGDNGVLFKVLKK